VQISKKLAWNNHTDITAKKGAQSLNFLWRNFLELHYVRRLCYKTLVRPQLEFASTVVPESVAKLLATDLAS